MSARKYESAAVAVALRALKLRKGRPTEADRPPVTPLPGPKPTVLPGQRSLLGFYEDA